MPDPLSRCASSRTSRCAFMFWMRKGGKKKWKFGDKPGVFVQLESKELQGLWFLPTKAGVVPDSSSAQPLDVDTFRLIPPLYK